MFRNRQPRVTTAFPVRIWGVDANCRPFMQMASITNVSDGGIQLNGVQCRLKPGEVVDVQYEDTKAEYLVVWAGQRGTACEGELGLQIGIKNIWMQPPTAFNADCIAAVREGARVSGFSTRDMISGAGHDAAYVSRVAPAAMIFVPCKDGISHNEAEFSSKEQCAAGAQVLLQAVLDYDRRLAERYGK